MATERLEITDKEIRAARAMAEAGKTPDGKIHAYTDTKFTGLQLRVQARKAAWVVRWGDYSPTIGYVHPVGDRTITALKTVRDIAAATLSLLKQDPSKVKIFLQSVHSSQTIAKALEAAHSHQEQNATTWTLRECFERTIEDKRNPNHKNHIGPQMEKDLRITLGRACYQAVLNKPAVYVTADDIENVRDTVKKQAEAVGQSGISPSNKVITHTRAVLDYCATTHRGKSGLGESQPWWKMLGTVFKNPQKTRRPDVEAIVKTMLLAEEYLNKPLPGRAIQTPGTTPNTLAALWWIILTVQRANAGMSLLPYNIGPDLERPDSGCLLAAWDKDVMKAGQSFVLPVPERAWNFVNGIRSRGKHLDNSEWVFPSVKSTTEKSIHTTPSGIYQIVARLAGKKNPEQKFEGERKNKVPPRTELRNLLAENDIDWWSMHDVRRTLTGVMRDAKMPGGASAILAHEVTEKEVLTATATELQKADFRKQRTAKITRMAYGGESQFIELKSEAMKVWTDVILDEYERQKGANLATFEAAE
ncbi:hypothetical protein [Agrobacterium tumefaciens]|uniref:hypothetical protein n=1 Tax=Agrobacterium tumefaciens TaxID=358 RepID=UPI00286405C8|nr:hypothetical protein [Agrobacterium tumefaciens]MDR6587384.1 hypothetical protein [Agrobacterium tumefaciens]